MQQAGKGQATNAGSWQLLNREQFLEIRKQTIEAKGIQIKSVFEINKCISAGINCESAKLEDELQMRSNLPVSAGLGTWGQDGG